MQVYSGYKIAMMSFFFVMLVETSSIAWSALK